MPNLRGTWTCKGLLAWAYRLQCPAKPSTPGGAKTASCSRLAAMWAWVPWNPHSLPLRTLAAASVTMTALPAPAGPAAILDTVAAAYAPRWSVTATAPGQLWLEKRGQDALVHGAAGQTFDWIVIIPQRGYENQYAEPVDGSPPPAQVPSRDVADVLPGTIDPPSDIIPNTDTIAASQSLAAERRPA